MKNWSGGGGDILNSLGSRSCRSRSGIAKLLRNGVRRRLEDKRITIEGRDSHLIGLRFPAHQDILVL